MDREAWCAAVHEVARSWTWLTDWNELNWTELKVHNTCNLLESPWNNALSSSVRKLFSMKRVPTAKKVRDHWSREIFGKEQNICMTQIPLNLVFSSSVGFEHSLDGIKQTLLNKSRLVKSFFIQSFKSIYWVLRCIMSCSRHWIPEFCLLNTLLCSKVLVYDQKDLLVTSFINAWEHILWKRHCIAKCAFHHSFIGETRHKLETMHWYVPINFKEKQNKIWQCL